MIRSLRFTALLVCLGAILALSSIFACSDKGETPAAGGSPVGVAATDDGAAPKGAPLTPFDPKTAGTLRATAEFAGTPPERNKIQMSADASCVEANKTPVLSEEVVVEGGKLANVFICIRKGLESVQFPAPSGEALLDQKGCRYVPHVVGVQVGQSLKVSNSDGTTHNVHTFPKKTATVNRAQPATSPPIVSTFKTAELGVMARCDIHPWMNAVIHVVTNPIYAVTDAAGSALLPPLPPGKYTVEAIHESLGTQTAEVEIKSGAEAKVGFTFKAR